MSCCHGTGRLRHPRSPLRRLDKCTSTRSITSRPSIASRSSSVQTKTSASEMEIEDGVIWVYGVGEDGVLAFTDFGIESLIELIKMYKDNPTLLKRWIGQNELHGAYAGCLRSNERHCDTPSRMQWVVQLLGQR